MESGLYEINFEGKMEKIDTMQNSDLPIGTIVQWGGNMAWAPEDFVLAEKIESSYGVMYKAIALKDARYHNIECHSIKRKGDPSVWHSQHFFVQDRVLSEEDVTALRVEADNKVRTEQQIQQRAEIEGERLLKIGKELFDKHIPKEAKSLIIAERNINESDSQTDYFAHRTEEVVILGWSKHNKDLFSEMKKFAKVIPETEHLSESKFEPIVVIKEGFSCNGRCYGEGQYSHWHDELMKDANGNKLFFKNKEEADDYIMNHPADAVTFDDKLVHFGWEIVEREIEHREKYSMGGGYYLKDGHSDSTGWKVSKQGIYYGAHSSWNNQYYLSLAKRCIFGGE
jgi:hypothetical protein